MFSDPRRCSWGERQRAVLLSNVKARSVPQVDQSKREFRIWLTIELHMKAVTIYCEISMNSDLLWPEIWADPGGAGGRPSGGDPFSGARASSSILDRAGNAPGPRSRRQSCRWRCRPDGVPAASGKGRSLAAGRRFRRRPRSGPCHAALHRAGPPAPPSLKRWPSTRICSMPRGPSGAFPSGESDLAWRRGGPREPGPSPRSASRRRRFRRSFWRPWAAARMAAGGGGDPGALASTGLVAPDRRAAAMRGRGTLRGRAGDASRSKEAGRCIPIPRSSDSLRRR